MTRFLPQITRALPLAAMITFAAVAGAQAAAPVFHCDSSTVADRTEEIATIREYLAQLSDPQNDIDERGQQIADYSKRLKELELGVSSCKELRDFEKGQRRPAKAPKPVKPPFVPSPEDDLLAPSPKPPFEPSPEDDLLAPTTPSEDDLLAPSPKPAKPPAKPKSNNPPMAPFPAPVGTPKF